MAQTYLKNVYKTYKVIYIFKKTNTCFESVEKE